MHDLIIKGGKVVDGTGQSAFTGEVAITAGRISGVGKDLGPARRTLKADGLLVTPGWVDVHTHYDGQVTWDQLGNRDSLYEMLTHPMTVMGGSDAGAHMRFICDVSAQTFMLTDWVRDCAKDDRYHLPVEFVVKKQSHDTARLFDMYDRGTLEPGMKADLNLIDLNALRIETPALVHDLPAGMPRLTQTAQGYVATVVSSEVVQENGKATGARPGKVVRGGQCTA